MKTFSLIFIAVLVYSNANAQAGAEDVIFNIQYNVGGYNVRCHGDLLDINPVIIGANMPLTYTWYNDAGGVISTSLNLSGLAVGVGHFILEIHKGSWSGQWDLYLYEPDQLGLILTPTVHAGGFHITEHGGSDGVVTTQVQGGVPPYTYSWSNSSNSESLNEVAAGAYSLTVTDAGGCQVTQSVTLTEPTLLHVVSIASPLHNGYNVSGKNGVDGAISLTVAGGTPPYSYRWSNGNMEKDIDTLPAHSYTVEVTDANHAVIEGNINLTEPTELTATLTPHDLSCFDCNNGSITTTVTGGVSPYTYLWSNGRTTASINNLPAHGYSLVVTDANGIRIEREVNIGAPERDDWSMGGNAGTNPATQFMGTTDNQDFVFKTNNVERLRLNANGTFRLASIAGIGNRLLITDPYGSITSGAPIEQNDLPTVCSLINTLPWYKANTIGPSGLHDIVNCQQRFGFGTITPQERVHIAGYARFFSGNPVNYLNIGFNTNSQINSYGTDLFINDETQQNVKFCTGSTNSGNVTIGGNSFLASLHGRLQLFGEGDNNPASFQILNNDQVPFRRGISIDQTGKFNFYVHSWESNASFNFFTNDETNGVIKNLMNIKANGTVYIGNSSYTNADYKLAVEGKIIAHEVVVLLHPWPDFVLKPNYKLKSLSELKRYLIEFGHLPEIPSANEIESSGLSLGDIVGKQMQKIEELTLYVLELQKQIDELKKHK